MWNILDSRFHLLLLPWSCCITLKFLAHYLIAIHVFMLRLLSCTIFPSSTSHSAASLALQQGLSLFSAPWIQRNAGELSFDQSEQRSESVSTTRPQMTPPPPPTYLNLSIATVLQHAISQGGGGCSWNAKHQILAYGSALVSESLCREILYPPRSPWSEFTVTADPPSSFSKLFMPLTLQCATQISQSLSIPTFLLLCGFETLTTATDYFFTLKHKLSFTHH